MVVIFLPVHLIVRLLSRLSIQLCASLWMFFSAGFCSAFWEKKCVLKAELIRVGFYIPEEKISAISAIWIFSSRDSEKYFFIVLYAVLKLWVFFRQLQRFFSSFFLLFFSVNWIYDSLQYRVLNKRKRRKKWSDFLHVFSYLISGAKSSPTKNFRFKFLNRVSHVFSDVSPPFL